MSKYDEDLKKACEILNNTELDELVQVAVEAMDDAATDIGMEASQEWHAKITLESALIHIAEKVAKRPQLTIPKSIADEIEEKKLDDYGVFQTLAQKKHIISDPEPFCDLSDGFISWCENNEKWWAIMNAYLAGKALGVDLVKVGEG